MFQVRDSVMTRVSLSWSQDNEVTIAGLGMLNRLGLTKKDLQVTVLSAQKVLQKHGQITNL